MEIEHIDADALEAVQAELGVDVQPLPATLRIIQARRSLRGGALSRPLEARDVCMQ